MKTLRFIGGWRLRHSYVDVVRGTAHVTRLVALLAASLGRLGPICMGRFVYLFYAGWVLQLDGQ